MFKWWGRGKVDFSEMLKLSGEFTADDGEMKGEFIHPSSSISFPVHYKYFPGMVLAWVKTEIK